MPVERRLRTGLSRNAETVHPDVDRLLSRVQRRARRRVLARRTAAGLAVAVAVAAGVVAAPRALHAIRVAPAPPAVQLTQRPLSLQGTFSRTVAPGSAAVQSKHMAGSWTIRLQNGTIEAVTAPSAFTGLVTMFQYQLNGEVFRTNLFIGDVCLNQPAGTYRWAVTGKILRFITVSDPCQARAALLTSGPWQKTS